MRTIQGKWVTNPDYRSVLYFAQTLDEMVWQEAREMYRIPALNTYHRCIELIGAASEIVAARLPFPILDPMFEELLYLGERDPVIKEWYSGPFEELQTLCKKSESYPDRISSVKLFFTKTHNYIRNCRALIERMIDVNAISHNPELYICISIFSSYLLNEGVSAFYISDCLYRHFLRRVLTHKRVREIQEFFSYFPTKSSQFGVYVRVTASLNELVTGSGAAKLAAHCAGIPAPRNPKTTEQHLIVFEQVEARDFFSARMKCENELSTARAVAYTVNPHSDVAWSPEITVRDEVGTDRTTEAMTHALRQRHKVIQREVERVIELRNRVLLRENFSDQDRNRLTNSLLAYANAFHSEHPSTQLVALWFSVEAILPNPPPDEIRIRIFAKDILATQRRLYLKHVFNWLFVDFLRMYNEPFLAILDEVNGYSQRLSQFTASLCFPEYYDVGKKLFTLADNSPLAQQRGLVLHRAAKNCGDLYGLVDDCCKVVEWQLHRIYRERNRIAHQANPSQNVSTLITNLNEYYLCLLEALFDALEANENLPLDEIFWRIRLEERYRSEAVNRHKKEGLDKSNADAVLGFQL
jgi:hypothetical protein